MTAHSADGGTSVAAGGIGTLSAHLTMERTLVIGNRTSADGPTGVAPGGGIWNTQFGGGPPELALSNSVVTANQLTATPRDNADSGAGLQRRRHARDAESSCPESHVMGGLRARRSARCVSRLYMRLHAYMF